MTTLDVLITARKLLSNPKRWTKGTLVKPSRDEGVDECYCALGAVCKSLGIESNGYAFNFAPDFYATEEGKAYQAAQKRLSDSLPGRRKGGWVPGFNDNLDTTHTDVMQVFSDAIDLDLVTGDQQVLALSFLAGPGRGA